MKFYKSFLIIYLFRINKKYIFVQSDSIKNSVYIIKKLSILSLNIFNGGFI